MKNSTVRTLIKIDWAANGNEFHHKNTESPLTGAIEANQNGFQVGSPVNFR